MYRIADFNVNIRYMYPENKEFFADYEISDDVKEDYFVASTDREIEMELEACLKLDPPQIHSNMYAERLVILRKLCAMLIERDTFLLHGVAVEYGGKGYLFCAPSGTGKSTHVMLWQKAFGADVHIVNGDKPLVRMIDGKFYAYGTPWCGKEGFNINTRVQISAVGFIERASENLAEKLDETEAIRRLLSQIDVSGTADFIKLFGLAGGIVESCNAYKLCCNMDVSAANVAYNAMR
ncbi:MAG: hypothetical protein IKY12_06420 [Clostridia bacterium]|nr:hypothetical protein [Clostridia bacterium]